MQTRLSQKLRAHANKPGVDPDTKRRADWAALELDRAKASLGPNLTKGGVYYGNARRIYCELSGKAWGWAAEKDLEIVESKSDGDA